MFLYIPGCRLWGQSLSQASSAGVTTWWSIGGLLLALTRETFQPLLLLYKGSEEEFVNRGHLPSVWAVPCNT